VKNTVDTSWIGGTISIHRHIRLAKGIRVRQKIFFGFEIRARKKYFLALKSRFQIFYVYIFRVDNWLSNGANQNKLSSYMPNSNYMGV